jgi:hypothetical protein
MFRRRAESRERTPGSQHKGAERALRRAAGTPHLSSPMVTYRSLSFAQASQRCHAVSNSATHDGVELVVRESKREH